MNLKEFASQNNLSYAQARQWKARGRIVTDGDGFRIVTSARKCDSVTAQQCDSQSASVTVEPAPDSVTVYPAAVALEQAAASSVPTGKAPPIAGRVEESSDAPWYQETKPRTSVEIVNWEASKLPDDVEPAPIPEQARTTVALRFMPGAGHRFGLVGSETDPDVILDRLWSDRSIEPVLSEWDIIEAGKPAPRGIDPLAELRAEIQELQALLCGAGGSAGDSGRQVLEIGGKRIKSNYTGDRASLALIDGI